MSKLTIVYEDAGFKAMREVEITSEQHWGQDVLGVVVDAVNEVRAAKDANRVRDNILPGPGGIPA